MDDPTALATFSNRSALSCRRDLKIPGPHTMGLCSTPLQHIYNLDLQVTNSHHRSHSAA